VQSQGDGGEGTIADTHQTAKLHLGFVEGPFNPGESHLGGPQGHHADFGSRKIRKLHFAVMEKRRSWHHKAPALPKGKMDHLAMLDERTEGTQYMIDAIALQASDQKLVRGMIGSNRGEHLVGIGGILVGIMADIEPIQGRLDGVQIPHDNRLEPGGKADISRRISRVNVLASTRQSHHFVSRKIGSCQDTQDSYSHLASSLSQIEIFAHSKFQMCVIYSIRNIIQTQDILARPGNDELSFVFSSQERTL